MPASLWKEPLWLQSKEGEERTRLLLCYHLAIVALHATPEGTMRALADMIGVQEGQFSRIKATGVISPNLCVTLEKTVGRDVMPREVLLPSVFHVGDRA